MSAPVRPGDRVRVFPSGITGRVVSLILGDGVLVQPDGDPTGQHRRVLRLANVEPLPEEGDTPHIVVMVRPEAERN